MASLDKTAGDITSSDMDRGDISGILEKCKINNGSSSIRQ
jgi:hypothetical protein